MVKPLLDFTCKMTTHKITIKNKDDVDYKIVKIEDDNTSKYITTSYESDEFVKEAPQFDDLTMIGLRYIGPTSKDGSNDAKNVKELVVKADRNNLDEVQAFIDQKLEEVNCSMKTQTTIDIAIEEIFVNIASYAYGNSDGEATIQVVMNEDPLSIEITFIDSGAEYNPLAKPDPNTSLKLMERQKGGLGIFMVKKSMDDMTYEYKDGKNVLTIVKNL